SAIPRKLRPALALFLAAFECLAGDWPQFLGPHRNGASPEQLATGWSAQPPRQRWKQPAGAGFAGPVVSRNVVLLFHRQGDAEILQAFDAKSGESKWRNSAPTAYRDDFGFDEGPRAVPCIR